MMKKELLSVRDLLGAVLGSLCHKRKGECKKMPAAILRAGVFGLPSPEVAGEGFLHQTLWVLDVGAHSYVLSLGEATGRKTKLVFDCELIIIPDQRRGENQEMISEAIKNLKGAFKCTILLGCANGSLQIPKDSYYNVVATANKLTDLPVEYLEFIPPSSDENAASIIAANQKSCHQLYQPSAVRHLAQNLLAALQVITS